MTEESRTATLKVLLMGLRQTVGEQVWQQFLAPMPTAVPWCFGDVGMNGVQQYNGTSYTLQDPSLHAATQEQPQHQLTAQALHGTQAVPMAMSQSLGNAGAQPLPLSAQPLPGISGQQQGHPLQHQHTHQIAHHHPSQQYHPSPEQVWLKLSKYPPKQFGFWFR